MKLSIGIAIIFFSGYLYADVNELKKNDDQIISQDSSVEADGTYHYAYETSNGIKAEQGGSLKQIGDLQGEISHGQYSYTGDDGQAISLKYVADENGYQPEGDHLPTPPPVPEAIQKSLEYIAAHPYKAEATDAK